ncbi:CHAT domain protein [Ceratobasidium sp. AG-Ba]|nr:CHAT domain protein [Ceratobasidium sp. AG-Ba]
MSNTQAHGHEYTSPKVSLEERVRYLNKLSSMNQDFATPPCQALQISKRIKLTRPIPDPTARIYSAILVGDAFALLLLQLYNAFASRPFDEILANQMLESLECGALKPRTSPQRRVELFGVIAYLMWEKYQVCPTQQNIDQAKNAERRMLDITPDDDQEILEWLNRLGRTHRHRYQLLRQAEDLDLAISYYQRAVTTAFYDHPNMPSWYNNIGISCHMLYNHHGWTEYLEQAVNWLDLAAQLLFKLLGRLNDLEKSIHCAEDVPLLMEGEESNEYDRFARLGFSYLELFEQKADLEDLKKAIYYTERSLVFASRVKQELGAIIQLGDLYLQLFMRLGQVEHIDTSLDHFNRAMRLVSDDEPCKGMILSALGSGHHSRFTFLGDTRDLDLAIEYQELASKMLSSECWGKDLILNHLGCLYHTLFDRSGDLHYIDKAICCLSEAVATAPDVDSQKSSWIYNLAHAYHSRFRRLERLEDVDLAIEWQLKGISLIHSQHNNYPGYQNILGNFYDSRFSFSGDFEDIHNSIACQQKALRIAPENHPERPRWSSSLGLAWMKLYKRLGVLSDLESSIFCFEQAVNLTPHGHTERAKRLENLGDSEVLGGCTRINPNGQHRNRMLMKLGGGYIARAPLSGNPDDLITGLSYEESAVSMMPDDHPEKPLGLSLLGSTYFNLGHVSNYTELLYFSLPLLEEAIRLTPTGHPTHAQILYQLGRAHLEIAERTTGASHREVALQCFQNAALSSGDSEVCLSASLSWARCSPTPLEGYMRAISLLPQVVWLGTPVTRRYERLISDVRDIVTEAAAAAISSDNFTLALEWLEEGRSIVWNQMIRLRIPLDDLFAINPAMASQIQEIARNLDKASAPYATSLDQTSDGHSFQQAAQEHRRLTVKWENLLEEVRQLPGFDNFLLPKPFSELANASKHTTVVLVNMHSTRCDAIALKQGSTGVLPISLPNFSLTKAKEIQGRLTQFLQGARVRFNDNQRSIFTRRKTQCSFKVLLFTLWVDIVEPVLRALGYLDYTPENELPHITWCTTGPLAFLPLHAAGDYGNPDARIYNYVVSSYTPNLSTLLRPRPNSSNFRGVLAVGQADSTSHVPLPCTILELDQVQEAVGGKPFTRLEGSNATSEAVLTAMETHSWVHLACHASQDPSNPISSAFHLWGGEMTLAAITQKELPHADFAFLSACQTAMGYDQLPDEAVHLAAGMLMAGYSSVIATMWSIRDEDAPLVAEEVYVHMLKGDAPNSRRAARALHRAVEKLRTTIGEQEFMSWIPYIHLGC